MDPGATCPASPANADAAVQVLLAMADELGKFVPFVGGPAYAHTLLEPLETLCCTEETVVREKAVESMALVGAELPEASSEEHFFPLVQAIPLRCASPLAALRKRASCVLRLQGLRGPLWHGAAARACPWCPQDQVMPTGRAVRAARAVAAWPVRREAAGSQQPGAARLPAP